MSNQQIQDLAGIIAQRINQPRNDPEFTYQDHGIEKTAIRSPQALRDAVEEQIDDHLGGTEMLFTRNDTVTSTIEWARLVHGYMGTTYVMEGITVADVHTAVREIKDKYREQILANMANNQIYATSDVEPYSVENLKEILIGGGAFLENDDDEVLEMIFDKTLGQDVDYRADWIEEEGDITSSPGARGDLVKLIDECSGNLHSAQIGTVVGGIAVRGNVKKVAGLDDASARIDRQNPPPGAFNVQFQTGGTSHACVIFDQSDPHDVVLEKLLESFDNGMQMRSPRVGT